MPKERNREKIPLAPVGGRFPCLRKSPRVWHPTGYPSPKDLTCCVQRLPTFGSPPWLAERASLRSSSYPWLGATRQCSASHAGQETQTSREETPVRSDPCHQQGVALSSPWRTTGWHLHEVCILSVCLAVLLCLLGLKTRLSAASLREGQR